MTKTKKAKVVLTPQTENTEKVTPKETVLKLVKKVDCEKADLNKADKQVLLNKTILTPSASFSYTFKKPLKPIGFDEIGQKVIYEKETPQHKEDVVMSESDLIQKHKELYNGFTFEERQNLPLYQSFDNDKKAYLKMYAQKRVLNAFSPFSK